MDAKALFDKCTDAIRTPAQEQELMLTLQKISKTPIDSTSQLIDKTPILPHLDRNVLEYQTPEPLLPTAKRTRSTATAGEEEIVIKTPVLSGTKIEYRTPEFTPQQGRPRNARIKSSMSEKKNKKRGKSRGRIDQLIFD